MASQAHSFPSTSSYSLLQEPIDSLVAIRKRPLVARQLLLSVAVACTILASRHSCHLVSCYTLAALSDQHPHGCNQINSISSKSDGIRLSCNHESHYSPAQRQWQPRIKSSRDSVHYDHHNLHCLHHLRLVSPLVPSWQDCDQDPRLRHHSVSCIEYSCLRCSSLHCLPPERMVQVSELPKRTVMLEIDLLPL